MPVVFSHRPFAALSLMELHDILWLRNEVFVVGQKITDEAEVDGHDPECTHVFGVDAGSGHTVATARVFLAKTPVKVGRVAVARECQRGGVGTELMQVVHEVIGARDAALSAQAYLQGWYERLGWIAEGEIYHEAGIPHIWMVRPATAASR